MYMDQVGLQIKFQIRTKSAQNQPWLLSAAVSCAECFCCCWKDKAFPQMEKRLFQRTLWVFTNYFWKPPQIKSCNCFWCTNTMEQFYKISRILTKPFQHCKFITFMYLLKIIDLNMPLQTFGPHSVTLSDIHTHFLTCSKWPTIKIKTV